MGSETNHYSLLGVPRDATPEELRRAYREAARRLHPDANPSQANTELFLRIQKAYEVLSDAQRRAEYDRTLPAESEAIKISSLYSRMTVPVVAEPQLVFVLLELVAPAHSTDIPAPPLNVSLVLDRSTSMHGARMDMVKTTAIELMRQMRPQDLLSIITFSDRADVFLPSGIRGDLREYETRIQMLQTSGGTEIFQGLNAGYGEVVRMASAKYVNHVVLITDGRTYGDEERCLELARKAGERGIGISGLGIGHEWNDTFLDQLASLTGGHTAYIARPQDIKTFLENKFTRLGKVYADAVRLDFSKDEGVKLNYAFRLQPEADPLPVQTSSLQLGSIPRQDPLRILLEFMVPSLPLEAPEVVLAEGRMRMEIPSTQSTQYSRYLRLVCKTSARATYEPPPPEIVKALSQLTLYRMQEKAHLDVVQGKPVEASRRLQNLATHLVNQGEDDLAHTVMTEAENVERTRNLSAEGSKAIKYGTRSLILPAKKEEHPK